MIPVFAHSEPFQYSRTSVGMILVLFADRLFSRAVVALSASNTTVAPGLPKAESALK